MARGYAMDDRHPVSRSPPDRVLVALASLAALVAAAAALVAWAVPGFYAADPAAVRPQLYGQDLVTLAASAAIALAVARLRRGSVRARIVVLGGMLYLAYGSLMYAFGVRFNELFLAYVATLGLATFALIVGLARFPLRDLGGATPARRPLIVFFLVIPLLFGGLWLSDILGAYARGGIPNGALEVEMPTSPVHVEDLAFVLPLSAATAALVWRRSAWATALSGIVLVKAITICLAMLAMALMAWRDAQPVNAPVAVAALATLAVAASLSWAYFRGLPPRRPSPARPRPDRVEVTP